MIFNLAVLKLIIGPVNGKSHTKWIPNTVSHILNEYQNYII